MWLKNGPVRSHSMSLQTSFTRRIKKSSELIYKWGSNAGLRLHYPINRADQIMMSFVVFPRSEFTSERCSKGQFVWFWSARGSFGWWMWHSRKEKSFRCFKQFWDWTSFLPSHDAIVVHALLDSKKCGWRVPIWVFTQASPLALDVRDIVPRVDLKHVWYRAIDL